MASSLKIAFYVIVTAVFVLAIFWIFWWIRKNTDPIKLTNINIENLSEDERDVLRRYCRATKKKPRK
jgi:uncharacterized membrane protein